MQINKLKTVPADLSKLNNVLANDIVKNTVYNKLVIKSNAIDTKISNTSRLLTKRKEKKIADVDKKIPNSTGLVKKTNYNTKITEIENKIPSFTGLVTAASPITKATKIENKIPDTTNFIATPECSTLTKISSDTRNKEVTKSIANKSQLDIR